jgi:hypothetical protein
MREKEKEVLLGFVIIIMTFWIFGFLVVLWLLLFNYDSSYWMIFLKIVGIDAVMFLIYYLLKKDLWV